MKACEKKMAKQDMQKHDLLKEQLPRALKLFGIPEKMVIDFGPIQGNQQKK